jgi:heterodisulfide reductase subunit D
MNPFSEIIKKNRAWFCLDCGKCSSVCPITLHLVDGYTSPRLLVETAVGSGEKDLLEDPLLWSCLTCNRCTEICPSVVQFSEFIQDARQLAREKDQSGDCTHSEMIQTWIRMMVKPDLQQNRLEWINDGLVVSEDSDTIYFPGCLPYYDPSFSNLEAEGIEIARGAVKILNHLGIKPIVLENERCCGHDQYWQGEMDTFQGLAEINLNIIKSTGAKRIITTCPECAYTLKHIYPEQIGSTGMEVLHLTEFLADPEILDQLNIEVETDSQQVTYQDPCRLGRFSGVYQQPRDLIMELGFTLTEMEHSRRSSTCCGTSCWSSCGQVNKRIQVERLGEARSTGAEMLITTCQKCQIHFKCAQKDPGLDEEIQIPIRDLTILIAERI